VLPGITLVEVESTRDITVVVVEMQRPNQLMFCEHFCFLSFSTSGSRCWTDCSDKDKKNPLGLNFRVQKERSFFSPVFKLTPDLPGDGKTSPSKLL